MYAVQLHEVSRTQGRRGQKVIERTRRRAVALVADGLVGDDREIVELGFETKLVEKIDLDFHGGFSEVARNVMWPLLSAKWPVRKKSRGNAGVRASQHAFSRPAVADAEGRIPGPRWGPAFPDNGRWTPGPEAMQRSRVFKRIKAGCAIGTLRRARQQLLRKQAGVPRQCREVARTEVESPGCPGFRQRQNGQVALQRPG